MNDLVSLPSEFFESICEPLIEPIERLWCPVCLKSTFIEMKALYPKKLPLFTRIRQAVSDFLWSRKRAKKYETGYWCTSCGVCTRKSELNQLIDKHLNGETRRVKINMEPKTLTLFARIRRAVSVFSWMR